ncbi:MAG: methylmalonyl-CoA mutase family protein, partial [Aestuariivirgaceae bacterium]
DAWRERVERVLKGASAERLITSTLDGIDIQPLSPADHTASPIARSAIGWTIVQRVDIPDTARANAQALEDLMGGAGGLPLVMPETVTAGAHGLAIRTIDDLQRLFENVELDLSTLRLDAGGHGRWAAPLLLSLYAARNPNPELCQVHFAMDPIGRFALGGTLSSRNVMAERMAALFNQVGDAGLGGTVFAADTRVYHGAGASPAQELGLAIATGVEYLRVLQSQQISLETAALNLSFVLTADADLFMTMAKLRAARLLWARLLDVMELPPSDIWIDVETSLRMMAKRDPHVNMLRTGSAILAAGIAGANSITTLPMTAASGLPDGFARRMARNSQLILQEESGIGRTGDAAAGSGYVETLTGDLAQSAWQLFQAVEGKGGMLAALQSGYIGAQLADTQAKRASQIAERALPLTGVTEFPNLKEHPIEVLDIALPGSWTPADPAGDGETAISGGSLPQIRDAEPYEQLRDRADAHQAVNSEPTGIFLANLGAAHQFTARASWTRNLFAVAGIEAANVGGFASAGDAAQAFKHSGLSIACICSSDDVYEEMAVASAQALKAAGAGRLYMAGDPASLHDALVSAGVDEFLRHGIDIRPALERTQGALGMAEA